MLLITAGERPASVYFRGGEVRIDVHDQWYLRSRARLMADIIALHPDAVTPSDRLITVAHKDEKTGSTFRYARRVMGNFESEQIHWYAVFGLRPPKHVSMKFKGMRKLYGKPSSKGYYAPVVIRQSNPLAITKSMGLC